GGGSFPLETWYPGCAIHLDQGHRQSGSPREFAEDDSCGRNQSLRLHSVAQHARPDRKVHGLLQSSASVRRERCHCQRNHCCSAHACDRSIKRLGKFASIRTTLPPVGRRRQGLRNVSSRPEERHYFLEQRGGTTVWVDARRSR